MVNKPDAVHTILKLVASSTTSTSVNEVKPVVIILRNLIRIQYDSLPTNAEELLQNIIKSTKLLKIIKDQVECEWLFRITYNSAIKVPKEISLLYFEQAITIWLLTEQSHIEIITNCLNIAIEYRLQSAYVTRSEAIDDHLQKAKDLLKMLQDDRFSSTIATKFEIQILIMDGSYDQAFQLISDCNLELSVWKELAHLLIEKLKCPSRRKYFSSSCVQDACQINGAN